MNIHVAPIPEHFLKRTREQGADDQGQPVRRLVAEGGEPCRDVLRRARPGEALILASFSPFSQEGPYREYGPVFILAHASPEEVHRDRLPVAGDDGYFSSQLVLRAYDHSEAIADAALVTLDDAMATLERYLQRDEIAFVDARFPAYGCFACRVVRG